MLILPTLGGSQQDMSLLETAAGGGTGTIMALLGSALALVPNFIGSNVTLAEW